MYIEISMLSMFLICCHVTILVFPALFNSDLLLKLPHYKFRMCPLADFCMCLKNMFYVYQYLVSVYIVCSSVCVSLRYMSIYLDQHSLSCTEVRHPYSCRGIQSLHIIIITHFILLCLFFYCFQSVNGQCSGMNKPHMFLFVSLSRQNIFAWNLGFVRKK